MSMLATQINNLISSPPIIKNLLGFKVIDEDKWCEKAIKTLVKKVKDSRKLEELLKALSLQDSATECVTIPRSQDGRLQVSQRKGFPHVMYCRIWRWADLQNCNELKSINSCQFGFSSRKEDVCINPYHYVRIDSANKISSHPLTVYVPTKFNNEQKQIPSKAFNNLNLNNDDNALDVIMTNSTNNNSIVNNNNNILDNTDATVGTSSLNENCNLANNYNPNSNSNIGLQNFDLPYMDSPTSLSSINANPLSPISIASQVSPFMSEDDSSEINANDMRSPNSFDLQPVRYVEQTYWCSISYYELKQRVGETFHAVSSVNSLTIDGYTDPSKAERFCLGVLSNINRTPEIDLTRRYIGRGIRLYSTGYQVIAECLSENPVFVQSPICNKQHNWHLATVCKIPTGCKLPIFDMNVFSQLLAETVNKGYEEVYALTRICTIRMSFVKGWGAEYRRQSILNTPCWIEIHLNNPLQWIDSILTTMGSPRNVITSNS